MEIGEFEFYSGSSLFSSSGQNLQEWEQNTMNVLLETELDRETITFRSPQPRLRRNILNFLYSATDELEIERETLHLAVYILDCFMDKFVLYNETQELVAMACVILAGKLNGPEQTRPRLVTFNLWAGTNFCGDDYIRTEILILNAMEYNLLRPTVITFLGHFMKLMVAENVEKYMVRYCADKIYYLGDMSIIYIQFVNVRPSKLAAACIAATRLLMRIQDIWPPSLAALVNFDEEEIRGCVHTLVALYESLHYKEVAHNSIIHKNQPTSARANMQTPSIGAGNNDDDDNSIATLETSMPELKISGCNNGEFEETHKAIPYDPSYY